MLGDEESGYPENANNRNENALDDVWPGTFGQNFQQCKKKIDGC